MRLSPEDRGQVVMILSEVPEFETPEGRRELLRGAGFDSLIRRIDAAGAPYIAASRVVSFLVDYGRVSEQRHAVGLLLNFIKPMVGLEKQKVLDTVLLRYGLMTPIAASYDVDDWRGSNDVAAIAEKIINENTLRPISYLEGGLEAARAVTYLEVVVSGQQWSGTGFMISRDIMLTNNHVVSNDMEAAHTIVRFNYENDRFGRARKVDDVRLDSGSFLHTHPRLDYTALRVPGYPGDRYGWLRLSPHAPRVRQRVAIIQHPGGQAKQIALQHNQVEYVGEDVLQYVTSTLPGSSGSPVFDDDWAVVAIHHAGGSMSEPETGRVFFRNEGIRATSLLRDLSTAADITGLQRHAQPGDEPS